MGKYTLKYVDEDGTTTIKEFSLVGLESVLAEVTSFLVGVGFTYISELDWVSIHQVEEEDGEEVDGEDY